VGRVGRVGQVRRVGSAGRASRGGMIILRDARGIQEDRKDGALANASYWYRRAGKSFVTVSLEQEWWRIVKAMLKRE